MPYFIKEQWFDSKGEVDRIQLYEYTSDGKMSKMRFSSQHRYAEDLYIYGQNGMLVARISIDQDGLQQHSFQYRYDENNESLPAHVVYSNGNGHVESETEYVYARNQLVESVTTDRQSKVMRKKYIYEDDRLLEISVSIDDHEFQVMHRCLYDEAGCLQSLENPPIDPTVKREEYIKFVYNSDGTLKELCPLSRALPMGGRMVKLTWKEGLFDNDYVQWLMNMMIYG